MSWLEELENMESHVEIDNESIKENNFDPLDEFYDKCEIIKDSVSSLLELEMLGEDVSETMEFMSGCLENLLKFGKNKFNLSDSDIDRIRRDVFGGNSKTR